MLTALDLQEGLTALGAASVEIAGTVEKAMEQVTEKTPDAVVLDWDLDGMTSLPLAEELNRLAVPFIFMASEIERRAIPLHFEDVPVVSKPCTAELIAERLRDALMPHLIRAVLNDLV